MLFPDPDSFLPSIASLSGLYLSLLSIISHFRLSVLKDENDFAVKLLPQQLIFIHAHLYWIILLSILKIMGDSTVAM